MKYSTHQSWHVKLTYGVEGNKISGLQVHVKIEILYFAALSKKLVGTLKTSNQ